VNPFTEEPVGEALPEAVPVPEPDEEPAPVFTHTHDPQPAPLTQPDHPAPCDARPEVSTVELLQCVIAFREALGGVDGAITARAGALASAAIQALLPTLSREGLAQEIALQLPTLIPPQVSLLNIEGPDEVIDALVISLGESRVDLSGLSFRFIRNPSAIGVTLGWDDGGADFDFGPLRERTLAWIADNDPKAKDR
jgi:hypothetical protein